MKMKKLLLFYLRQTWGQFSGHNEFSDFSSIQSCLVFLFGNSVRKPTAIVEEIQKETISRILEEQNKFGDMVQIAMVTCSFMLLLCSLNSSSFNICCIITSNILSYLS